LPEAHDGPWPHVPSSTCARMQPHCSGSVTTCHLTNDATNRPPRPCASSTALRFFCETITKAKSPFTFSSSPSHSSSFSVALPPPLPCSLCATVGRRRCPHVLPPPRATTASTMSHRAEDQPEAVGRLQPPSDPANTPVGST
jgi:hypothetical protein